MLRGLRTTGYEFDVILFPHAALLLSRECFSNHTKACSIHPAKNKQIDYSFSFLLSKCISNEIHCLEDCSGVFQLPVSWNELLVVFHGHDLIKFNPSIWFLLALFNCNILFYLIHFLREKHLPVMFAVTILIGCAGFYLGKLQIELPLYIDVSMTALLLCGRFLDPTV